MNFFNLRARKLVPFSIEEKFFLRKYKKLFQSGFFLFFELGKFPYCRFSYAVVWTKFRRSQVCLDSQAGITL